MSRRGLRPPSPRAATCSLFVAVALASVLPAPAMSANLNPGGAFSELAGGGQETTTTAPKTTSNAPATETTNSHTVILLSLGAAVLVLSGIGFVIARDARRVAPAGDPDAIERGSARDSAARLRRRRAKAKAARQQRKRNR